MTLLRVAAIKRISLSSLVLIGACSCAMCDVQVATVADYDLYCHYVAGLVGVGLSQLFGKPQALAAITCSS